MHINTIAEIWPGLTQQPLLIKEKLAIELADKVRFTTEFMMERYRSFGYEIDPDRCYLQKHPFSFNKSEPFTLDQIDTLLFFGKRNKTKGYPSFIDALKIVFDKNHLAGIKRIIVLGPKDETLVEENRYLEGLKGYQNLEVEQFDLPRSHALELVRRVAPRALCVMPYRQDNLRVLYFGGDQSGVSVSSAFRAGGLPNWCHLPSMDTVYRPYQRRRTSQNVEHCLALAAHSRTHLVTGSTSHSRTTR